MKARPTSVTILSWFLIITACFSVFSTMRTLDSSLAQELLKKSSLPIPVQYGMAATHVMVLTICGSWTLFGRRWARTTYLSWSAVSLIVGFATSPFKAIMIPGTVFFVVVTFLLFRPKANAFFADAERDEGAPNAWRRAPGRVRLLLVHYAADFLHLRCTSDEVDARVCSRWYCERMHARWSGIEAFPEVETRRRNRAVHIPLTLSRRMAPAAGHGAFATTSTSTTACEAGQQGAKPADEVHRRELDGPCAVAPGLLEGDPQAAIGQLGEAVKGGWARPWAPHTSLD